MQTTHKLFYGLALALLVLLMGMAVSQGAAADEKSPDLTITGAGPEANCLPSGSKAALKAPSISQGQKIGFDLSGFADREIIAIRLTLPDGRKLSLAEAGALDGPVDSVNYRVPNPLRSDAGGSLFFNYSSGRTWPAGCYAIQASGLRSARTATTHLLVKPASQPSTSNNHIILLTVVDNEGTTSAPPDVTITMNGKGFLANERIILQATLPNSTTERLPFQPVTSASGDFTLSFRFSPARQIGHYRFSATGMRSSFNADAGFELIPASPAPQAGLEALVFPIRNQPDNQRVEIRGRQFTPGEGITLVLKTPLPPPTHGISFSLPMVFADQTGNMVTSLVLDSSYPAGSYNVTATGMESGRVVGVTFDRIPQSQPGGK